MAVNGQYVIQAKMGNTWPHHQNFKALWETKWKMPCKIGVYPFMFGAIQDFEPIAEELIAKDLKEPYDWDEYASTFAPHAERLVAGAAAAEKEGNKEKASELYLRASAVYRISRFPTPRSAKQREAWKLGVEATANGLRLRENPSEAIVIPHSHASGEDGSAIPAFYNLPSSASASNKVPLVVLICGLDGYRTEMACWIQPLHDHGCATLIVEIPGTGDCPAAKADPESWERVLDSIDGWIKQQGSIDASKTLAWGFSTGGHYALRTALARPRMFTAIVAQGGGAHHMFDPAWLDFADRGEYPFDLTHSLMHKFGYTDYAAFRAEAQPRYSLLASGLLDRKDTTPLMLINGTDDSIFPVDDYLLAIQHGDAKEVRLVPGRAHMGEPEALEHGLKFLFKHLGIDSTAQKFAPGLIYKAKY